METWLFVEEGRRRLGLSANAFCLRAHLKWVTQGITEPVEKAQYPDKRVARETLRRRYQEACAFLREENRPYRAAKDLLGTQNSQFDGISPTEKWWRQVLEQRLAVVR
jgi:hypothetical protein